MLNHVITKLKELEIERFSRVSGFTTNGLWLIKSELEVSSLRKKEASTPLDGDSVRAVIEKAINADLVPLTIIKVKQLDYRLVAELQDEAGNKYFANAHFLKLATKLPGSVIYGNTRNWLAPLVIRNNNVLMALVMPLAIKEL